MGKKWVLFVCLGKGHRQGIRGSNNPTCHLILYPQHPSSLKNTRACTLPHFLLPRSSCCFGDMRKPPNLSDWEAFLCARVSHKDDLKSALFFESFDEVGRFGIFVLEGGFFVAFHCSLHCSVCCACTSIIEHIIWTSQPNRGSFSRQHK